MISTCTFRLKRLLAFNFVLVIPEFCSVQLLCSNIISWSWTSHSNRKNKQTKQKKTEPKQGINLPLPECYVLRNDRGKTRSKFFFWRNTLSSHRRCIKLNFISTTVSEQAGTLTLSVEEMFFFRKSLYITLKQDHTATQHLYSFYCLLIRKKIVELLRPSRTRSLTFSPWKSCPFVFLRRHSLLCGFLSTSCRPIGNIYFFVTDVVAWLRDEKTLELKSDSQLEYRGRAVIPIAHPGEINAVPLCSSNLFWPFLTVAFQIADIRSRSMNQV